MVECKLKDIFFRVVEVFTDSIIKLVKAGTAGDHMAHDQVRLEVEEVVGFPFASCIGQNTGCLLE